MEGSSISQLGTGFWGAWFGSWESLTVSVPPPCQSWRWLLCDQMEDEPSPLLVSTISKKCYEKLADEFRCLCEVLENWKGGVNLWFRGREFASNMRWIESRNHKSWHSLNFFDMDLLASCLLKASWQRLKAWNGVLTKVLEGTDSGAPHYLHGFHCTRKDDW